MMIKYRVHEVAKDFDKSSKDILDIIKAHCEGEKKSMTALEENELDVIFEVLTKDNAVKSFKEYFAEGLSKPKKEKKPEKSEKRDDLRAEQERIAKELLKQAELAAKAENAQKANDAKKADSADGAQKAPEKAAAKNEGKTAVQKPAEAKPQNAPGKAAAAKDGKKAAAKAAGQPAEKKPAPENLHPFKAKEKKEPGVQPNRGPAQVRHIDTRTVNVNIDKYNERYENIAPANSYKDNMQRKQKIKQKSQDYRRPRGAKRESEADKLRRMQLEKIKKTPVTVTVGDEVVVRDLAVAMKKPATDIIKTLLKLGIMATINDTIDFDTAELIVTELGCKIQRQVTVTIEERIMDDTEDKAEDLKPRDPIVVVMGHVDHGKTSILDAIRHSAVTDTEAGGITQHIGAYRVRRGDRDITFLDTPGHAAFTAMRLRGAQCTDIAVLVVAAEDGIMPQTIEAINHAKAAKVQVIVAMNKMDKPEANPDRIKQQLTEHGLVPEEWGGDVICVPVSAKTHEGIDELLENILLVSDMMELKANPDRRAKGTVVEARLDKGRGPVATILVQNGTLHTGDVLVAGTAVGRVRVMTNENGVELSKAGPSVPVEITGLAEVPSAGDAIDAVSDERLARQLVEQRKHKQKEETWNAAQKVTLDNLFSQLEEGEMKDLNIIVKADVQGSVEAVRDSLEKLSNDEVRVRVIHGGVGAVNESDVMLAGTSGAIIVGFNVRPDPVAKENAEHDGVEIRLYRVIYDCIEEIEAAMKGMLAPKYREVVMGTMEVRQTYKISGIGTIAGTYVTGGKVTRACEIRVVRDGIVIAEDKIQSLRRFKDDVKEVSQGYECGVGLEKFQDIKDGDILEAFVMEEYRD